MFEKCYSLTSLNLNNFNTLKVTSMYNMFHGCTNLEYINLKNFVESTSLNADGMFLNAPNNVVICINSQKAKDKIYPQIQSLKCYSIDCYNNWSLKQKKYLIIMNVQKVVILQNINMNLMENAMIIAHMDFYTMIIIIK